jgi:hypothetical protein
LLKIFVNIDRATLLTAQICREGRPAFTRLTDAFSKKLENLKAALSLHFAWYNFCRIHQTLRVTPAMQAGVSDHVWSIAEVMGLIDLDIARAA